MEQMVVFFDDVCVLCSRSVRFIYRHDPGGHFRFASFDSEAFKEIEKQLAGQPVVGSNGEAPASVVLYRRGRIYLRSAAALRIAMSLRFPLPLLAVGFLVPPFIRDRIYDWIARNRYRWFGRREHCFLPDGGLRKRFLA
jgi:predicted DCC family thiol-disulfide oxidoreductase YuxK